MLSLIDHGVRRSRQAAGLDRLRLRFVLPPQLPDELAATPLPGCGRWQRRPAST